MKKIISKKDNSNISAKSDTGMKVKRVILSIAIAIIFALFVGFGISTFYENPEYEDFCDTDFRGVLNTSATCEAAGGKWTTVESAAPVPKDIESGKTTGYCDRDFYCREDFETAEEKYDKNVFIITLVVGILTIIASVLLKLPSVSSGLMAGGAITIIYGVIRYWRHSTDLLRFIILGVVLIILIWLGYKKLNK